MKINLNNKCKPNKDIRVGDVVVYYSLEYDDYDYFMLVEIFGAQYPYRLLRLEDGCITDKYFDYLYDLIEYAKQPTNGYRLHEIIPSDELELRRL